MHKRVLFVEDDDVIRENYTELLTDEGFDIDACGDRQTALARAQSQQPDLALLDISLKQERDAGFQLCADLRRLLPRLPIIFLTSHDSEMDKISGIRLGADDYLTKDVSLDYLIVRMEALLRRFQTLTGEPLPPAAAEPAGRPESKLVLGSLTIDRERLTARWRGQPVELTLTQLWITQALAELPGQVKTYGQLMRAANIVVEPNTITAHVNMIRNRFKAVDADFDCIKTERSVGYRWADV